MPTARAASPKVALTVVATLAATGIIATVAFIVDIAGWRGGVDKVLSEQEHTKKDVSTALTVLGDHGTEFAHLRGEIQMLRGELLATRTELLEAVSDKSNDRFRGSDWERESKILDLRFQRIEEKLSEIHESLDELKNE